MPGASRRYWRRRWLSLSIRYQGDEQRDASIVQEITGLRGSEMQRSAVIALCLGLLAWPAASFAQQPENIVLEGKDLKQLTPHVWAIFGNPNIGIVVGSKGTLVVDTGLGKRNGATVDAVVEKLRKGGKLYVATTHFHPEHVT